MAKDPKNKNNESTKKSVPKKQEQSTAMVTEDGEIMTLSQAKAAVKK